MKALIVLFLLAAGVTFLLSADGGGEAPWLTGGTTDEPEPWTGPPPTFTELPVDLAGLFGEEDYVAVRVRCAGQTRYLYRTDHRDPWGDNAVNVGSARFAGLPDGTHDVDATYVRKDGTRLLRRYRIVVALDGSGAWAALRSGTDAAERELAQLAKEFDRTFATDRGGAGGGAQRFAGLAYAAGTPHAYELARDLVAHAESVFAAEDIGIAIAHEQLAMLAAGANNDLAAAKGHWERREKLLDGIRKRPADDLAWWPAAVSFD